LSPHSKYRVAKPRILTSIRVDPDLWHEFRQAAYSAKRGRKGWLSDALDEALRMWLSRHKYRVVP